MNAFERRRLYKLLYKIIALSFYWITMSIGVLTKYFTRFNTTTMTLYTYVYICEQVVKTWTHNTICSSSHLVFSLGHVSPWFLLTTCAPVSPLWLDDFLWCSHHCFYIYFLNILYRHKTLKLGLKESI
jgi:hypothetical protein